MISDYLSRTKDLTCEKSIKGWLYLNLLHENRLDVVFTPYGCSWSRCWRTWCGSYSWQGRHPVCQGQVPAGNKLFSILDVYTASEKSAVVK